MLDGIEELTFHVSYLIPFIWFRYRGCFTGFPVIKYTYVACLKVAMWFAFVLCGLIVLRIPGRYIHRNSHRRCSVRKSVLRNFEKNSQENTCARLSFLIKFQAETWNFIKIEILAQVFSSEFREISKSAFSTEHLRTTASVNTRKKLI